MASDRGLDELGVVVLAYGIRDRHEALLTDLTMNGVAEDRIVVSHNPDRSPTTWRAACPPGATLLSHERNLGYSGAMNRGIEVCRRRGDRQILLLTDDVRLPEGSVANVVATSSEHPEFGILGLAVAGAGNAEVSYGCYLGPECLVRHITQRPVTASVAEVPWVDGCSLLVRVDALDDEPLPEQFFLYFEEVELCSRVRAKGWRVGTAVDVDARSVSGISSRRLAFLYLYTRNGLAWSARWRGRRATMRFAAWELNRAWASAPAPWRPGFWNRASRRRSAGQALARILGLADFARGRFGPPPTALLRSSDVQGA